MESVSQQLGNKTKHPSRNSFSQINVINLDPTMQYCFRQKKEFSERDVDEYGYMPVSESNYAGEVLDGSESAKAFSRARKQIIVGDTILCKRTKEDAERQKDFENLKYNSQLKLVKKAAPTARGKMRHLGHLLTIRDESQGLQKLKQRPGPTIEE